jgi:hypothetical protein
LAEKVDHFDGGGGGFGAFVAAFAAGAVDGLLDGVAGQDAENHWDAGREGGLGDAVGGGAGECRNWIRLVAILNWITD